jgi:HPt (histidine-containing phosphotransfer) domain-containing protein
VDNDVGFLSETVDMLAADGPSLLAEVRKAAAANDAAGVGRHAHSLKGMLSNFCAPAAHACAYELERMGKQGDVSGVNEAAGRMDGLLSTLIAELQTFVKAHL